MHRMLIIVWCAVATFLGSASGFADPQLSAGASLTPQVLVGGANVTFQFSLTNSGAAESSNLSNSVLQVSWSSAAINGVQQYFNLISVNTPGGSVSFVFDGNDIIGVHVNYGLLSKGTNRTFGVSFQIPNSGLVNGAVFNVAATLTWPQPPGTLTRSASATLQASPSLQASLDPVPTFTAPGGSVIYRAHHANVGSGITHKAWLVAPVPTNAAPAHIAVLTTNAAVWYSTLPYTIEQANTDGFIRSHFVPATFDPWGIPLIPPGTKMIAVSLDDPVLNLLPCGLPQEFAWQIQDLPAVEGTVIDQGFWMLSEDWPATQAIPRRTTIRALPADLTLVKMQDSAVLMFAGDPVASYQIQRSAAFVGWTNLGSAFQTNLGFFQFIDTNPPPSKAFYRITAPAP
jgi:hypothetical protein